MVGAVDVVADQPAGGAADQDIGGKVLFGEDSADAYGGGQSVDRGLISQPGYSSAITEARAQAAVAWFEGKEHRSGWN